MWKDCILPGHAFVRAIPCFTVRPGYDLRDLLNLYIYVDLKEIRSSRRIERECNGSVQVIWLTRNWHPPYGYS
ncbi:MAG: hypothetical protein BGO82_11270 [Devosia sp. 67-54]|nr:MAG: hypothetical protein BGO82_11270 [Devosia sp. 67-54]